MPKVFVDTVAAWYIGVLQGSDFLDGASIFAVEVRGKNDYGSAAEGAMQEKRADYFTCGTLVVWDVHVLREHVIRVYRTSDPDHPTIYRLGDIAEAEPVVLGWRLAVDALLACNTLVEPSATTAEDIPGI